MIAAFPSSALMPTFYRVATEVVGEVSTQERSRTVGRHEPGAREDGRDRRRRGVPTAATGDRAGRHARAWAPGLQRRRWAPGGGRRGRQPPTDPRRRTLRRLLSRRCDRVLRRRKAGLLGPT